MDDLPVPGRQRSWWLREALAAEGDPPPAPALARDTDADVVIVGGGYTGMWAAYFIHERRPDARIVLLEQDICGGGPSGRNGGFVHGWWESLGYLTERFGPMRPWRSRARPTRSSTGSARGPGSTRSTPTT